jgi:hypothetical protein
MVDYGDNDLGAVFNLDPDEVDVQDALYREAEKSPQHCIKIIAGSMLIQSMHDELAQPAAAHFLSCVGTSRSEIEAKVQADFAAEQKAQEEAKKPVFPQAPAARLANSEGGAQAAPKGAKRKKLSQEEAELGIAEAMQAVEQAAPAGAVAPPQGRFSGSAEDLAYWETLAKGDRVQVEQDCPIDKRRGKVGKLSSQAGQSWWVNFGGRSGSDLIAEQDLQKVSA